MKKIVSILLLVAMVFALASCAVVPATTDTNTNTNTNSDTSTGTSTDTSANTNADNKQEILDYDQTRYQPKKSFDGKNLFYSTYSVKAPLITPYYNDYKAAVSMTFDDGASLEAAKTTAEILSEFGFEGTLMLIAGSLNDNNISGWQELVSEGVLDVGGHGWGHQPPNDSMTDAEIEREIKDTMDLLKKYFPDENPLTFATPEARITDKYLAYLKEYGIIANRLSSGYTISSSDALENNEMFNLAAPRIDNGNPAFGAEIEVASAVKSGKWFIELMHSVTEGNASINITPKDFRAHCQNLYDAYNGEVWFGSYDDVAKYITQSRVTTIEYTACDKESMTYLVKSEKDYGAVLTAKFYLPLIVDSAYAVINGQEEIYTEVEKEVSRYGTRYYVMVNMPVSEDGIEIKLVLGGNFNYKNNCKHGVDESLCDYLYEEKEVVPSTKESFGYTEMVCPNCHHTYKSKYTNKIED